MSNFVRKLEDFISIVIKKLSSYGLYEWHIALFLFLLPTFVMWIFDVEIFIWTLVALFWLSFLILPFLYMGKAWDSWQAWRRIKFLNSQEKVLFEVKIPENFNKTPNAMEIFFNSIHISPGESTFIDVYKKGSTRPWWSFEIVSFEGEIKFFIWTWKKFADFIESQIQAQFPNVKLKEVQDYLQGFEVDLERINVWGTDYKFNKPDAYPIKTYIDFNLDKGDGDDPFLNVLEKLSKFKEGEVAILQIMIQVTKNKNWKKEVEEEIEKIYEQRAESYPSMHDPSEMVKGMAQLRPQDWDLVNTLKHSVEKNAFDTGIRSVYIARRDKFDPGKIGVNLVHMFRAYASSEHNYLIGVVHWLAGYDYPWQDFKDLVQDKKRHEVVVAAKYRSYFNPPYTFDPLVLTTEELASIYHFPKTDDGPVKLNKVSQEVPENLPI